MRYILLVISILFIQQINAQSTKSIGFEISGILVSNDDKLPLEAATVYLERKKDSTVVSYTITDNKGKFSLEGDTKDMELYFNISYVGFKAYRKEINLAKEAVIDMKEVLLKPDANELNEVVLKLSPPILVKKDTLEFNVKSFKTKKDANVEDLIKVLPGAEVDAEGNITVNGKPVNKVLINGKSFFGSDPTIATRNFPKDIIEKVQILDSKSKSQAFTGEDSDGENKTINLVVKKENNKGVFGRTAAGVGTDDRYEYAGMYNRFDNDQKFSALLGGNNVNSPGFSFGEIRKMFGGDSGVSSRSFGGGDGITTSDNVGFNYADDYGKNVEFNSNYFYSGSDSQNESSKDRENFYPDFSNFTSTNSESTSSSDSHTANFEVDIKKDSTWLINISPSFKFSKSNTVFIEDETVVDENQNPINDSNSSSNVESDNRSVSTEVDITRRYGSKGGFIRLGADVGVSVLNSDDYLLSELNVINDSSLDTDRNLYSDIENSSLDLGTSLTYRLPILPKQLFIDFNYSFNRDKNTSDKKTYEFDTNTDAYKNVIVNNLSTDYINIDKSHVPKVGFNYSTDKIRLRYNGAYRFRTLENDDNLRTSFERQFNNFEQDADFRYRFSEKSSFNVRYNLRNNTPSLSNLQAFEDVSNPTNTVVGNPDLKPEKSHSVNVFFNNYNFQKRIGFYSYANGSFTNDQTVSKIAIVESTGNKRTTYENVDGNYNLSAYAGANKKFQFTDISTLDVRIGAGPGYNRDVNYNNDVMYVRKMLSFNPNFGLRYEVRDLLDIETRYTVSYTNSQYDVASIREQNFTAHNVSINTTTMVPKGVEWSNSVSYNYNPNIADGFQKSSWFWNMTLSYAVLNDKGLISLKAYDLLNQNTNASRTANENYIQDSQSTVLKQYFMVGFSWKFNTLGNKGENEERGKGSRGSGGGNRGSRGGGR